MRRSKTNAVKSKRRRRRRRRRRRCWSTGESSLALKDIQRPLIIVMNAL
jgi:hypothetical protein